MIIADMRIQGRQLVALNVAFLNLSQKSRVDPAQSSQESELACLSGEYHHDTRLTWWLRFLAALQGQFCLSCHVTGICTY